jgi:hypothetical protein
MHAFRLLKLLQVVLLYGHYSRLEASHQAIKCILQPLFQIPLGHKLLFVSTYL